MRILFTGGMLMLSSLVGSAADGIAVSAGHTIPDRDIRAAGTRDYNTHFVPVAAGSLAEWEFRKAQLRRQILLAAGLTPLPAKGPLHARVIRRIERHEYSVETVTLETLPGYFLSGDLYLPRGAAKRAPGVLIPHGHWKHGRLEDLESYSVPALGVNLARQGYVAFAYDMVGYNDTRQIPHFFGGWAEQLWSFNTMGLQLWDSLRALDYVQSLPGVDPRRIAVTGASGGATQTFLLAAVDDRVRVAAPVNMISAYMQGGDPCEEAPNLRLGTSNVEIAAMMAPRPMLVVSSTRDWTRHTPKEEFPWIRNVYNLYGAAADVENVHMNAEHNYNRQSREAVYRFFAQRLGMHLDPGRLVDQPFQPFAAADLLAFPAGAPPKGADGLPQIFQARKAAARAQTETADPAELRQLLREALGVEWPIQVVSDFEGSRLLLSRGKGDRVEARWFPGTGSPLLLVHPEGIAAGLQEPLAEEALRSGRPLLVIEAFRSSLTQARDARVRKYFFSYQQSEDAKRAQDIVAGLAFLKEHTDGPVQVAGLGEAGVWCLFAAASTPLDVDLLVDLSGFSGSDADFRDRFFVPGIQRAGGLQAAMRSVNGARIADPARPSGQ